MIAPKYDLVDKFYDGIARIKLNGKVGFIDKTDKEIVSPKYQSHIGFDELYRLSEGLARVILNDKYGFINKNGVEVIPINFENSLFSEYPAAS